MSYSFDASGSPDDYARSTGWGSQSEPESATLGAWFNSDVDAGSSHVLISLNDSQAGNFSRLTLYADSANPNSVVATKEMPTDGSGKAETSGATWSTGAWHHGGARFVNDNSRFAYIDGGDQDQNTTSINDEGTIENVDIGAEELDAAPGVNGFDGQLAEIAHYDPTDAGAAVIAQLALGFDPRLCRPDLLEHYWPLIGPAAYAVINLAPGATTADELTFNGPTQHQDHPRVFQWCGCL